MYPQLQNLRSLEYGRENEANAFRQMEEQLGTHILRVASSSTTMCLT